MIYGERLRQSAALVAWNAELGANVFGTLKFTSGYAISDERAEALIKRYWHKLDRLFYGQGLMRKGYGVARLVYLHKGDSGENTHFHFIARSSFKTSQFIPLSQHLWRELDSWTGTAKIEDIHSPQASSVYIQHELNKLGCDTLHTATCLTSPPPHNAADVRSMRQIKRILKFYDSAFV